MSQKPRHELIRARSERGLTQEKLAEKLNVELSTVARWERGRRSAQYRSIVALAELFDVPVEIVEHWFGMGSPPDVKEVSEVDPVAMAEAQLIARTAYREAMRSAGLSLSKIAEIRAHADLFIKGFEVARDQRHRRLRGG